MGEQAVRPDRAAWLKGPPAHCSSIPEPPPRVWRLILLGAPGVGKGTQAALLSQQLGACHLSTGDVFRCAKHAPESERTAAMTAAIDYMRKGHLVPDAIVLDLIRERCACLSCRGGFLLDGFPRTVAQALALDEILTQQGVTLDAVIDYQLPIEQIVDRISGRRTCETCKAVYHVTALPPKREGLCDHCGGRLLLREDDRPEAVRIRMEAYAANTAPLEEFYLRHQVLIPVKARGTPQEIAVRTMASLSIAV